MYRKNLISAIPWSIFFYIKLICADQYRLWSTTQAKNLNSLTQSMTTLAIYTVGKVTCLNVKNIIFVFSILIAKR